MQARAWHQTALTAAAGRHGRGRRLPRLPASPTRAQAAIRVAPKRIDSARAPSRTAALPVVRGEPSARPRARGGVSVSFLQRPLQKRPARRAAAHATVPGGLRTRA